MCGIWGIARFDDGPAALDQVRALHPVLRHRGPDDEASAAMGPVAFGHSRLAIIGPATDEAKQPKSDGKTLLTFNGEIYNFHEIVRDLRQEGLSVSDASDTEVLFTALAHWGVAKTLSRLDGMFAFAWYNHETGQLALCRDPIGEKFLYWGGNRKRIAFGSEIKAVLAAGTVTRAPNLDRIDDFLFTGKINGAATLFRDVQEVEPGTWINIDVRTGKSRIHSYWSLTDQPENGETDFFSIFQDAVTSRRISDVPIGVLLSGGIDSNALTRTLVEAAPEQALDLYFADNRNKEVSERPHAEAFLDRLKGDFPSTDIRFNHNILEFDDYHERMRRLTWHYDEPLQFMNSPLLGGLCDMARADGLKVLLSGEGSDELLYGYDRFARTDAELADISDPVARRRHLYFGGGIANVDVVRSLCGGHGGGAEATEAWQWLETHEARYETGKLQRLFSQRYRLLTLLQRQDRIGMASGMEIRVPFLMPRLVAAMNRLPTTDLFDAATRTTKLPLRKAMEDRLPEVILTKKKDGFPSDMHLWLREPRMGERLARLTENEASFTANYLDADRVRALRETHFSGQAHYDVLMWLLYSLETWHSVFQLSSPEQYTA